MSESQQEPPPSKRQHHLSLSSMKPPLVAPGEYHRFDAAETRGGGDVDQVAETIVIKSAVSFSSIDFTCGFLLVFLFVCNSRVFDF